MKTLIVSYLPSGENSNTRKLLEAFEKAAGKREIEHLDLLRDIPDCFGTDSLASYVQRHYIGQPLSAVQKAGLSKMDRMTAQLKGADALVIAFPMHNFSLPAPVKAWFDSVMLKGETWDLVNGQFIGLLKGKKALILNSSGGAYEGPMSGWDHAVSLAKLELTFMGFSDIRVVAAGGVNANPAKAGEIVGQAAEQAAAVAREWYGA